MKLVKRLLSLVNLAFLLIVTIMLLLRFVSADGFLGMLIPSTIAYHLALPLGFIIAWIFIFLDFSKTNGVIILAYFGLMWVDFSKTFGGMGYTQDNEGISIMSYNTRLMNYYGWSEDPEIRQKTIGMIHELSPDILCFQEYVEVSKADGFNTTDTILGLLEGYQHTTNYSTNQANKKKFGLITFSKYPIVESRKVKFENDPSNSALISKLAVDQDTLTVVNIHLGSIRFSKIDFADTAKWNEEEAKSKWRKLRESSKKREVQVVALLDSLREIDNNLIVCGDMNDTPHSKSYSMMTERLSDAIGVAKLGVHSTYNQFPFPLRIDYALYSKGITPLSYTGFNWRFSDHEPFKFVFKLSK